MRTLWLLWQVATSVSVEAAVDRASVPIGDEVVYTVRVSSARPGAFRVELPQLDGLLMMDRTERLDEARAAAQTTRTYFLEVRFRAGQVGTWRIDPVLVFLGNETTMAPPVTVVVTGAGAGAPAPNPRVASLINRVQNPTPGEPATLSVVVSKDRLYQGEQLDVLTAAWFSRSLRARLRRPPTLKPPALAGVWTVPQPAVPGIVATRAIGDEVYDLFVSHQVAFPLTAGSVVVPAARLEYAVPTSRRASGDERTVEAASDPVPVQVLSLPDPAPTAYRGPTAGGLRIGYGVRSLPAHAGEPLPVDLTVTGSGNLAFWLPPTVDWPAGTRAYLDRTTDAERTEAGLLGGTKTFRFLLLPDSVGSVALPTVAYSYFDPASASYRVATANGMVVPVLAGRSRVDRQPPALAGEGRVGSWSEPFAPGSPWWWIGVLGPLGLLALSALVRSRRPRHAARPERPDPLANLEHVIARLVPEAERGAPDRLEHGLRRAGVDRGVAAEITRLKGAADRVRFTPGDATRLSALQTDVAATLARLPKGLARGLVAGLLLVITGGASGQPTERPEALYRQGAFGPAARGFAARAVTTGTWQAWYNAGAARYAEGRDAEAAWYLDQALRRAPRAGPPRVLWSALERQYEPLHAARPPSGVTRIEAGAIALGIWWVFLAAAVLLRRRRVPAALAGGVALAALAAGVGWPTVGGSYGFLRAPVALRRSPHGLAPEQASLAALTKVSIVRLTPGWVLVQDKDGHEGWVPAAALASADQVN